MTTAAFVSPRAGEPAARPLAEIFDFPLSLDAFLSLGVRMADALSELHREGILHKNINPRTIACDPTTGNVTITGFQIASYLPREQPAAHSHSVLEGTLEYISPEQTGRMNRRIDHRSDLYSLGVTFYELLTGRLPLSATDALGWVHAHVALMPERPEAIVPSVPAPVSSIIMRLLAKAAEDRYESALGLRRDLERCAERLAQNGWIEPFSLGQGDAAARLSVPQRLYGRDAELRLLQGAFERVVTSGRPEFIVVAGYAGIGKSSLVHELHKPLLRERGLFISGKFEQYNRDIPYSTLVLAFRDLTQQILTESDEQLAAFRARLKAALGTHGRLIVDVLPEVKLIVGEQPPVPELGPTEAQNRFLRIFQSFIQAVARPEHPIALFLDDLQWADQATLDLLVALASDPELRHIAFILAYRDNEVGEAHPFQLALEKIRRAGAVETDIKLAPLDFESTAALVADTLRAPLAGAEPLARVVFRKTSGNPFFAGEFLKALYQEGLLIHDRERCAFHCDVDRIEARSITDNVVDLLLGRLKRLPVETRVALSLASCIGTTFRLELLAALCGKADSEIARDLRPAMDEELIASIGAAYPHVIPRDLDALRAVYRFEHDRIQQAAYSLLDEEKKCAMHLSVGRMILAQAQPDGVSDALFEIVNQLNLGRSLITRAEEERQLSSLNAAAGRKARAGAAYAQAQRYLRAAKELLPADAWTSSYDEALAIHCDLAECEYIAGSYDEAESLLDTALDKAKDLMALGRIYILRLLCYEKLSRMPEGLALGIAALRRFGVEIPETPEAVKAAFGAELATIKGIVGDRRIADLIDGPLMPEGVPKMTMVLLAYVNGFAYMLKPELFPLFCAKSVIIALQNGNGPFCAKTYGPFSVINVIALDDVETAYQYSLLALCLCEKFNDIRTRPSVLFSHGTFISRLREHYDAAVQYDEDCFEASIDSGDYGIGSYAGQDLPLLRFARGDRLESITQVTKKYEALARTSRQAANVRITQTQRQVLESLCGLLPERGALSGGSFDDAAMLELMKTSGDVQEVAFSGLSRLIHAFLYGRYGEAFAFAELTRAALAVHKGRVGEALYVFYRALTLAALESSLPDAPGDTRERREEIAAAESTLAHWAERAPMNFRHQHLLLSAERARVEGDALSALRLYGQAAAAAREQRFIHDEALAHELAAKLFIALGQPVAARAELAEAAERYRGWGASGKAAALEEAYPDIGLARQASARTLTASGAAIDALAAIAASQAISREIDRDRLLHRLMTITLQSAAAERGALLWMRGDQLVVLAEAGVESGEVKITLRDPASAGERLGVPTTILQYVRRSGASLVLDDASRDGRFLGAAKAQGALPRSVLCLPLLRQAELIGALYLENNLTTGAFTKDRTASLELLASQAAISLENATLYTDLRQENIERRRAEEEVWTLNSELEQRVEERTAELAAANVELAAANRELEAFSYSVSHDMQAPARTIDGYMEVLIEDYGPALDDEARSYMKRVRSMSRRMIELTEDMLHLARVTRVELERDDIDLSALGRIVAQSVQERTPERAVAWVIAEGLSAHADPKLVRILLENLLANAFKFTSKRKEAKIELGARAEPSGAQVYFVRDNGAGFDKHKAGRLFGVFQRLHKDADFAGNGVGLATAQRIVARHGGRIWAEGAVDKGATFYFTL